MDDGNLIPDRLYKYRSFDHRLLGWLIEGDVYFSDPADFNDPLDSRPKVTTELGMGFLFGILIQLLGAKHHDALERAIALFPDQLSALRNESESALFERADRELRRFHDEGVERGIATMERLAAEVEKELALRSQSGVLSLAEKPDCPLMWSHYGAQHYGICLGYSVPETVRQDLMRVNYRGDRWVHAIDVSDMLNHQPGALMKVNRQIFGQKAKAWAYEKEWRLLGPIGKQVSPLVLEDVIFGMRCPKNVVHTIRMALSQKTPVPTYWQVSVEDGSFDLRRSKI